jgi:hypothetical protein
MGYSLGLADRCEDRGLAAAPLQATINLFLDAAPGAIASRGGCYGSLERLERDASCDCRLLRHSSLDYDSPMNYERKHWPTPLRASA